MENKQNESHALESIVLATVSHYGPSALMLCHEAGLTAEKFTQPDASEIYELATRLNAESKLFEGSTHLFEQARATISPARIMELTSAMNCSGMPSLEIPKACRELNRLYSARLVKRRIDVAREAAAGADEDKIREALSALAETEMESKPRASWDQTAKVEISRAKDIIAGKEDFDERSIHWPWLELDQGFKPFRRGELVVLAGFVSYGKSSLLRQLMLGAAIAENNCVIVSLEVPAGDIFNLLSCAESGQSWSRLKQLHPKDQQEFVQGCERVKKLPIQALDGTSNLAGILAWIRNQHAKRFLDVVAIDYLGLIAECEPEKGQSKAHSVGMVTRAFKLLAQELGCVVLLGVQTNRGPVSDGNRNPKLTDLKDSGDIEAHADRVVMLHRPSTDEINGSAQNTHDKLMDRPRFYMQLFQEKGRNCGTGSGELWFNRALARFEMIKR